MVSEETYPCYIRIGESSDSEIMELPTESDGRILLTTITAQFPDAIGLKFKSESGAWRGVATTDNTLEPPLDGWGDKNYIVTIKKAGKRKIDEDTGPLGKAKKDGFQDLIVLGIPFSSTADDLKEYFDRFGELAYCEIKSDPTTKKSRGFGFIRFVSDDVTQQVLDSTHSLGGRNLEVRIPDGKRNKFQDNIHTKLFIGRLPTGTTVEDLKELFEDYGPLKDVYIPQNFRGFGFVTFGSQQAAQMAMNTSFQLKGNFLNITLPAPKPGEQQDMQMQMQQFGRYGHMQNMSNRGNMAMQGMGWQGNNMNKMQTVINGSSGNKSGGSGYYGSNFSR